MKRLIELTLVFCKESTDECRNPTILKFERTCKAKDTGSFTSYYYQNSENRKMQLSKNFEVDKHMIIYEDYEPRYVIDNKIKYKVKNILKANKSNRIDILDCEEVEHD